ncbi:hypothetical protein [Bacillus sp. V5-8f]|uniref:hypothetical protein n=1 Tax=Bacillus sp. V5-8f TaxID=2053044 RepID=UPI000C783DA7|nr:hypothetical protein [Bacillus sp. V5-8f]PLT31995.1 hypothetical protein CUU64_20640 [Bacillus sp. V5-8f]
MLYETKEKGKEILPEGEHWRIVSLDLSDLDNIKDWTHEREWRCKGDFEFDIRVANVIINDHIGYNEFIEKVMNKNPDLLKEISGIITLQPVIN